jgi:tRNA(fMet)-specific endonuclease VapC
MNFLLDTNICSAYLKGDPAVWNKFLQYSGGLAISVVTAGELWTWVARNKASEKSRSAVSDFLDLMEIVDIDLTIALRFGDLRGKLLDVGNPIPDMDGLIAATALVGNLTLVTHNVDDFQSVPALRVEDWLNSK